MKQNFIRSFMFFALVPDFWFGNNNSVLFLSVERSFELKHMVELT